MPVEPEQVLLFVGVENASRSRMTEACARMHEGHRLLTYSAGPKPGGSVNPQAVQAMRQQGYEFSSDGLQVFYDLPEYCRFDVLVTKSCRTSRGHVPALMREEWLLPDPWNLPHTQFIQVCDMLERTSAGSVGPVRYLNVRRACL
ncbi:MAG: arsenate reductase ArsC [Gammaproteobacteria bacterium]|nr:arsenate reductase ArsC [Gammaproteobacteria bacterium]